MRDILRTALAPGLLLAALSACTVPPRGETRLEPSGYDALARCDLEDAELLFLRASRDDPSDAQSHFALGVAQQGLRKFDFARAAYADALATGAGQPVSARFTPCDETAPDGLSVTPGVTTIGDAVRSFMGAIPPEELEPLRASG